MSHLPNFDRLAGVYRWMEIATFGHALWRARCQFLDELRDCRTALVLGDGDGRFTARLLRENPHLRVEAVDASHAMLRALLRNIGIHRHRVSVQHADARQWQPGNSHYDLIVSHFFLDCLSTEEVAALAERLRPCTSGQTKWVVSEFAIPAGWFGRWIAQPLVASLYVAFRLLTGLRVGRLPMHHEALSSAGFVLGQERFSLGGLLVSEMWVWRCNMNGRSAAQIDSLSWNAGDPVECYSRVKIKPSSNGRLLLRAPKKSL
jgi:ubiquinone/menaquinone biosynthesis C-methylase UbiE